MISDKTWREKLKEEYNFDPKVPYSYERLSKYFTDANLDLEKMKPFEFLGAVYELTRAFGQLGSSLSMAFSDITTKVHIWRKLFNEDYPVLDSIQAVIEREMELKVQALNGENNSKQGHKKGTPHYKYESGARTLVRLSWFLHFMHATFRNLLDTSDPFSKCLQKAYTEVLAPNHGWMVKKVASVGLGLAPSKRATAYKVFLRK